MSSRGGSQLRHDISRAEAGTRSGLHTHGLEHLPRHQLYDAPVPRPNSALSPRSENLALPQSASAYSAGRSQTIKFGEEDVAHYYPSPGVVGQARHEQHVRRSDIPPTPVIGETSYPAGMPRRHQSQVASVDSTSSSSSSSPSTHGDYGYPARAYSDPFNGPAVQPSNPFESRDSFRADTPDSDRRDSIPGGDPLYSRSFRQNSEAESTRRGYPTTGFEEDQEESRRLVMRRESDADERIPIQGVRAGGIRLLPTPRRE